MSKFDVIGNPLHLFRERKTGPWNRGPMLAGKDMGPNVSIIGTLIFPDAVGLMAEFAAPGVLTVVLDHASGDRDLSLILQCGRGTELAEFKICVPKAESGGPARI